MIYVIDPLSIASDGWVSSVTSSNPVLRVAVSGFLVEIQEEIILPVPAGGGSYGGPRRKRKRFTIKAYINDKVYTEQIETEDLSVLAKDVMVEIVDDFTTPKLKVYIT